MPGDPSVSDADHTGREAAARMQATSPAMSRSIRDQSLAELGGVGSVLARQRRDHDELDRLIGRFRSGQGDDGWETFRRITRLSCTHAFAEEAVLWPAMRKRVPGAAALTLDVEQAHQEINELTAAVERAADDTERRALAERVISRLEHDVRVEEDALLPLLRDALEPAALRRLGARWELVRRTAPTRPHPVVSRRPPGNVLAALPLTLLDRQRDVLDRAARGSSGLAGGAAERIGRWLAAAAGAVERLPALRRGEDPSTEAPRTAEER